jgi:hypothetical protein
VRPTVTFTVPADRATGVALGSDVIAIFSEFMNASTFSIASFTVQRLGVTVAASVSYEGLTATLNPDVALAPNTTYTATIWASVEDLAGNAMLHDFVWSFRTGAASDTTRPVVVSTIPRDEAVDVAVNANVSATFNEAMNPSTLTGTTVTVANGVDLIAGSVTTVGATVTFSPDSDLTPSTLYTATITNAVTDLAGNAMSANYEWTFTTAATLDETPPGILFTNPEHLAIDVPTNATINAVFSEDMSLPSITTSTFTVAGTGTASVLGSVRYDALTQIGTFTPTGTLLSGTTYTATVKRDVQDLAGNMMISDYVWTFTTGDDASATPPVNLGTLSTFVAVAGAGLTNSNSSGITVLNGDVGLSPTATCLGDGEPCTGMNPIINGTLYANDPEGVAAQAKTDLTAAYVDAMSRPCWHDRERHLRNGSRAGRVHIRLNDEHRRRRRRHTRRTGRRECRMDFPNRIFAHSQQQRARDFD